MKTGTLRDRLVIQQPVADDANDYGEILDSWFKLDTVWGEVLELFGHEAVKAAQVSPEATIRVTTRYRADVNEAMRLKFGDRYLYPTTIIRDVRKVSLTWFCREER
jgi:SPP1 family predicted phage head-tail adaptor